jgi:hypothetical protein
VPEFSGLLPSLIHVGEEAGQALFEQVFDLTIVLQISAEGVSDKR